jgi:hypothetical protein
MPSPFEGIITSEMKTLFTNAIDALLEDTACTRPCRLVYGVTKWVDCPNCVFDAVGNKSSNRYQTGGPIAFRHGQTCPLCNGAGRKPDEPEEEPIYLMVLAEPNDWLRLGNFASRASNTSHTEDGIVTTMSKFTLYAKLTRAKELIIDTDIEDVVKPRYIREGVPQICGFGGSDYIFQKWRIAG